VNLVVFPDRLENARGDSLEVVDSGHRYAQRLPSRELRLPDAAA
jgi:hypothetical protein